MEFTAALRVELVTPPASLQIKVGKATYAKAAATFWRVVANNLDVKRLPKGLPVVRCPATSYGFNEDAQVRGVDVRAVGTQMHFTGHGRG